MWTGDRLGLSASLAPEFGPYPREGEQRAILIEGEPNDILLFGLGVRLRRVLSETVRRNKTPVFRFQPSPPVRRGRVADIRDRWPRQCAVVAACPTASSPSRAQKAGGPPSFKSAQVFGR